MSILSRRALLGSGAAGGILTAVAAVAADGTFGNPDQPAEGAVNVTNPKALIDPGPQDPGLAGNEPSFLSPPATDVNGMAQFWTSFDLAPKHIQNGGWARQITPADFKISTTIAGVNMRLGPGGVRELHWHQQAEWGDHDLRQLPRDNSGRERTSQRWPDVEGGRSLVLPGRPAPFVAGADRRRLEFVLAFDNGEFVGIQHTVGDRLARAYPAGRACQEFRQPAEVFKNIPVHNKWIYQSNTPVPPLPRSRRR